GGALAVLERELLEVVALLEVQPRAVGSHRFEADLARLVVARVAADHGVRVAAFGFDFGHELEGRALAAERHLVDDPAQAAVVLLVARPQDVDLDHHRGVLRSPVIVLEQGPETPVAVGKVEVELVLSHPTSRLRISAAAPPRNRSMASSE